MSDAANLPPVVPGAPRPLDPAANTPRPLDGGRSASPAFEALLERLTARAAELEERSRTLESPAELPGAVDAARASLEEAFALGNELLEAFRAARLEPGERP